MNDLERDKLKRFASDEVLFNAVLATLRNYIPLFQYEDGMTNQQIGELWRAHDTASQFLETAMKRLQARYKETPGRPVDKSNPAV